MNTLMAQGLELMLLGMGVVFVFLIALIAVTTAMSSLVQRFQEPEPEPAVPAATQSAGDDVPPAPVLAAIEQAIRLHRESSA